MPTPFERALALAAGVAALFAPAIADGQQAGSTPGNLRYLDVVPGLYRIADSSASSVGVVRFLRLMAEGAGREETITIREHPRQIGAVVQVGPSRQLWYTREYTPGSSPQLCLRMNVAERCLSIQVNMPHRDLWLYDENALFGTPTLVLQRASLERALE